MTKSTEPQTATNSSPVTLINVVEIPHDQVDTFVEGWTERVKILSEKPGFVSATLHQALAGETRFQLVNVALWRDQQALSDATKDPNFSGSTRATSTKLDVSTNPGLYRVAADQVAAGSEG